MHTRPHPHMPFSVAVHPQRDAVHIAPVGELDVATGVELEAQLHALRGSGFAHIVLDLGNLTFIDSTGVRIILAEDEFARSNGHDFSLIGGPPAVERVLHICGVGKHLRASTPASRGRPAGR